MSKGTHPRVTVTRVSHALTSLLYSQPFYVKKYLTILTFKQNRISDYPYLAVYLSICRGIFLYTWLLKSPSVELSLTLTHWSELYYYTVPDLPKLTVIQIPVSLKFCAGFKASSHNARIQGNLESKYKLEKREGNILSKPRPVAEFKITSSSRSNWSFFSWSRHRECLLLGVHLHNDTITIGISMYSHAGGCAFVKFGGYPTPINITEFKNNFELFLFSCLLLWWLMYFVLMV